MRKFILFILSVVWVANLLSQSPHGKNFKMNCSICHNPEGWKFKGKDNTFDHSKTHFPLTGQHKMLDCRQCHKDLVFSNAKTTCISCHEDVHQQTVGRDCERCHTTDAWLVKNISQIHRQSRFPLVGRHATADCYQCHKSASLLRFDPMRSECIDCHRSQYMAAPGHVGNYSQNCEECHKMNASEWKGAGFNHASFPLTQGHAGLDCAQCHGTPHQKVSSACVTCHQKDYDATTAPNHVTAKFSTNCTECHTTRAGWKPASFDHSKTGFALKGGHVGVDCIKCHVNGYSGTPTACVSCHLANYKATTNPSHAANNFSKECQTCHNETAWKPSTFNHNTTSFPLKGGHVGVECAKCHTNGYTGGTPTTCVSCHMKNYNATTNPAHAAAKFPTTCETCHTVTAWSPSTFNHNAYFPIKSGRHNVSCNICHTNSANYKVFTCLTASCHTKASTDSEHRGENGYVYNSTNCYSCHPTGKGD